MEPRDTDEFGGHFLVDYSGMSIKPTGVRHGPHEIVTSEKEEQEMRSLDQETKLMRAMNEIRKMDAKKMGTQERAMFTMIVDKILQKWGITQEYYQQNLRHLGTQQTLRRG